MRGAIANTFERVHAILANTIERVQARLGNTILSGLGEKHYRESARDTSEHYRESAGMGYIM